MLPRNPTVFCIALVFLFGACGRAHTTDTADSRLPHPDGGQDVVLEGPADAERPPQTCPPDDQPQRRWEQRGTGTMCLRDSVLYADRPSKLFVPGFCEEVSCAVEVAETYIDISLCTRALQGCAAQALAGHCDIPALGREGSFTVRVNGEQMFEIESMDSRVALPRDCFCSNGIQAPATPLDSYQPPNGLQSRDLANALAECTQP